MWEIRSAKLDTVLANWMLTCVMMKDERHLGTDGRRWESTKLGNWGKIRAVACRPLIKQEAIAKVTSDRQSNKRSQANLKKSRTKKSPVITWWKTWKLCFPSKLGVGQSWSGWRSSSLPPHHHQNKGRYRQSGGFRVLRTKRRGRTFEWALDQKKKTIVLELRFIK